MSEASVEQSTEGGSAPLEINETEQQARRLGWVPKDEFKGDPAKHRSAEEFLERGRNILPILQENNSRLQREVSDLKGTLKETQDATKELLDYTSKAEERAYKRAKAEIEGRINTATANADQAAVQAGLRDLEALEAPKPRPETKPPAQKLDPEIQDWLGKEKWYSPQNPALYGYASEAWQELERDKPGMSVSERLAEVKKRSVEKFPEKFGVNPARANASAVSTPSGDPPRRKTGKTYDDLPAEAKKACDKFVRTIPGYSRDQYVKDYDWS